MGRFDSFKEHTYVPNAVYDSLDTELTNVEGDVESIDARVTTNESDISTAEGNILSLTNQVAIFNKAMSGDLLLSVNPETTASESATITADIASDTKYVRTIEVTLVTTDDETHTWFNGTIPVATTENTNTDGVTAIEDGATTIQFVNGVASVTIEYTGTWIENDTNTVTFSASNAGEVLGYAIASATSVDTVANTV